MKKRKSNIDKGNPPMVPIINYVGYEDGRIILSLHPDCTITVTYQKKEEGHKHKVDGSISIIDYISCEAGMRHIFSDRPYCTMTVTNQKKA